MALFEELRFKEGIAWAENLLALVELDQGDAQAALRRLDTSLRLHTELGDLWRQASVLDALARATSMLGHLHLAARLLGAAASIRDTITAPVPACELPSLRETSGHLRQEIGRQAFDDLFRIGRDDRFERLQHAVAFAGRPGGSERSGG